MSVQSIVRHPAARPASGFVVAMTTLAVAGPSVAGGDALSIDLPPGYESVEILAGLRDPATMAFSPDGRLFVGERIQGRLRVAHAAPDGTWTLQAEPFHVFDVPVDGDGVPVRHRSSGVRGFDFDPDFAVTGALYVFVMQHEPRHNRVVRIAAAPDDPDRSDGRATELILLPFNGSESSGSHNGGMVLVGPDDHLYVSTGDGWNGGDTVQSLSTWTGKLLRIGLDGSIPADNPFADQADGDFRAIHSLGFRNPFGGSRHPETGEILVHDVRGTNKARIEPVVPGANHGHDGASGIGTPVGPWADLGLGDASHWIIGGGDWAPDCGPMGMLHAGDLFVTLWGRNSTDRGSIVRVVPDAGGGPPAVLPFAAAVQQDDPRGAMRPVAVQFGPDGLLYVLVSGYEAHSGRVHVIRPIPPTPDLDGDGSVGVGDLLTLLAAWGPCPIGTPCAADLDGDGAVATGDLLAVLAAWEVG